ncbi:MAG: hypothetical protein KJO36_05255 [Acidimicrobiia bacterium]|nr:hypothetical protein [Acidimicrobiia bacterium]
MSRSTAVWFAIAGISALGRWILEFADTRYYNPSSMLDYAAVISQSAAGVATGIALLLLLRNPPVRRGAFLVAIAAVGAISQGLGNLLEDVFDVEAGEWGFVLGGISMILALFAAGAAALSVTSPLRWSGAFLLVGATGGLLGHGLLAMGLAWIALSIWITRQLNKIDAVIDQPLQEPRGRR